MTEPIAHAADSGARVQSLVAHLEGTARRAGDFSAVFCDRLWGELAGRWHDLGKYASDFQVMIRAASGLDEFVEDPAVPGRIDHSSAGAVHATRVLPRGSADAVAAVIAGHHCGLADMDGNGGLAERLAAKDARYQAALRGGASEAILATAPPGRPACVRTDGPLEAQLRDWELWVRMVYSTLVDADSLDTEAFVEPERAASRAGFASIEELASRLDGYLAQLRRRSHGPVAVERERVQRAVRDGAGTPQGTYTLTVPTGGGKTLASLLFGLRHALRHGLRRVIVIPPFTSIIEQTARVFRQALGTDAVVEHHSALDPLRESRRAALAAENWDAPVVVSTAVQFFESLLANRRSRCRKLHNIARSVVILDEAQTLPPPFLATILDVLGTLTRGYGVTLVLSTATQPALARRERFPAGLDIRGELAPDPGALAETLKRVTVSWPAEPATPEPWDRVAARVAAHDTVLAVVHKKADARDLVLALDSLTSTVATRHLSGNMCPAHRSAVLEAIRSDLTAGRPVRVVSTQLIEAGVDVDFPVVFRALGGLDSLAQAAGRCNREGRLERGVLEVFVAPTTPPPGAPRAGFQVAQEMLAGRRDLDLFSPAVHDDFFRRLYAARNLDSAGIQSLRQERRFRTVAERFRLIEDGAVELVVPWGEAPEILTELGRRGPDRHLLRRLQRFVVRAPRSLFARLEASGATEETGGMVMALRSWFAHLYSERFGLAVGPAPSAEPETFVV